MVPKGLVSFVMWLRPSLLLQSIQGLVPDVLLLVAQQQRDVWQPLEQGHGQQHPGGRVLEQCRLGERQGDSKGVEATQHVNGQQLLMLPGKVPAGQPAGSMWSYARTT